MNENCQTNIYLLYQIMIKLITLIKLFQNYHQFFL